MAATTTIKVSTEVRDRLNSASAARGMTPGALISELVDSYERAQWFDAIARSYKNLPTDDDYHAETNEWDAATAGDGLADA